MNGFCYDYWRVQPDSNFVWVMRRFKTLSVSDECMLWDQPNCVFQGKHFYDLSLNCWTRGRLELRPAQKSGSSVGVGVPMEYSCSIRMV
eukprot:XP_001700904.1 predicted protein [Chlamydomonas reinhardtii]